MAEHHLAGEQRAGDGRVEGRRHRRRHPASQKRARQRSRQAQALGEPAAERGAQVDGRPLAAYRCPDADGSGIDQRRLETRRRRHAPAAKGIRFNGVGDAVGAAVGHGVTDEQPDQEPPGGGCQHDVPPRQVLGMDGKAFGAAPVKAHLHQGDGLAEGDDGTPRGGADDQRQDRQDELVVPDKPPEPQQLAAQSQPTPSGL